MRAGGALLIDGIRGPGNISWVFTRTVVTTGKIV